MKASKYVPASSQTILREPKKAKNSPRSAPKRHQQKPKTAKKANPNRKTKKEPNQDDPKTVLNDPRVD